MADPATSSNDEPPPEQLYKFNLPTYNDKACLWNSELYPYLRCNETFASADEMFDHIVNEHVLNAYVFSVFSSPYPAKVYTCMWFNRKTSHYCRWQIGDLDRYEGAALRDLMGHVRRHVDRLFDEAGVGDGDDAVGLDGLE